MCNSHIIITIDGPAGVGKSTLAKQVSEALDVAYLDTGAMFRTIALMLDTVPTHIGINKMCADENSACQDNDSEKKLLEYLGPITFSISGSGNNTSLYCNNRIVGDEVRSEKAGMLAAQAALIPAVRDFLKKAQQDIGATHSLVAEGRDMGTVIFPHAPCKFFLDASIEVRAQRRFLQLTELGQKANLEEIVRQIQERDAKDRNRTIAPLKPAEDAIIIDTSHKTLNEVLTQIVQTVHLHYKELT